MDASFIFMDQPSGWIWTPSWTAEDREEPAIVCFRKKLILDKLPEKMVVQISADTRYKFYVNGNLVEIGPNRGDGEVWYFDEKNLLPWLKEGENILAAFVLRFPEGSRNGNYGMWTTEFPGFYLKEADGHFGADDSFRTKKMTGCRIVKESDFYFAPLQFFEHRKGSREWQEFLYEGFDDDSWDNALVYSNGTIVRAASPGNLYPRTIPYMNQIFRRFQGIACIRKSKKTETEWTEFLRGEVPLEIPPNTSEIVEITAGQEMTGYLVLAMAQGSDSRIRILQSESYVVDGVKGDRTDWKNGELEGVTDVYEPGGYGTVDKPEVYEPFWFRTFRYIRLEITTGITPLMLLDSHYRETGYPLEIKTQVHTSDEAMTQIWDISQRTLRRCMQEIYMDGPFYEQLQYIMDARSQMLYTYVTAADDRLARKCMEDIKNSARHDGMLNSSAPQQWANVIPGYAAYYIAMVYDHMMYFGDKELARDHFPTIEGVLRFYQRNVDERGIVGKLGGPIRMEKYWSFIDWTPQWRETSGVPLAIKKGPITMESFLYIMGLQFAGKIALWLGRYGLAAEYEERARRVKDAVNRYCRGKDGFYQDGPGVGEYSQHCQVFAILTETVSADEGKRLLKATLEDKKRYAPCSISMSFYLYRALQKTGMYAETEKCWEHWKKMLRCNCTTCLEEDVTSRSDCHAWGAIALYELPAVTLGVEPAEPGYKTVKIKPDPGYFGWADGQVYTPAGMVKVAWNKKDDDKVHLEYQVPEGLNVVES